MSENRFTPTWKNAGVEADIISLTDGDCVVERNNKSVPQDYRIRIKINGKYYVGHLELSE